MKSIFLSALMAGSFFFANGQANPTGYKGLYAEPGISPDGSRIAFVSGYDIWEVPASGGVAHLLISNEADDSRPLYSPDGKYLAFVSTRTGRGDIYLFSFGDGSVKRLTYDDVYEEPSGWSPDSKSVYFHSSGKDISGMNDVFRVGVDGSTPVEITADRYVSEFFATAAPDNSFLAFAGHGISSRQWWRKGSSHLDQAQIWLYKINADNKGASAYQRFTEPGARDIWPLWSPSSKELFYVSDRNGNQNIWSKSMNGTASALTSFKSGRVLWPSIDKAASKIVFEKEFGIWVYNTATKEAREIPVTLSGVNTGPVFKHLRESSGFGGLTLSPDGKKIAFLAHNHVFVTSSQGGETFPVSTGEGIDNSLTWNAAGTVLVYSSYRNGNKSLYQYDFRTLKETQLTKGASDDMPSFAPDGQSLVYYRDGTELRLIDIKSGNDRLLVRGSFGNNPFYIEGAMGWSPDSKMLAYLNFGAKGLQNVWVVPVTSGKPVQVSFLANSSASDLCWSPDGRSIYFTTAQRTEESKVARVDLVPVLSTYKKDELLELFASKPAAEKKMAAKIDSILIEPRGISERITLLPLGVSVNALAMSHDGKQLLITAAVANQQHLFTYSTERDGQPAVVKQLTTSPGGKGNAVFSPDDKTVYYTEGGRLAAISVDSRTPRPVPATAEYDVDFNMEKPLVLRQAWNTLAESFYDTAFHHADWPAVYASYSKYVPLVRNQSELYRLINLMIGELNASHSGISAGSPAGENSTGHLGLRFDPRELEKNGVYKITEVIMQGPADITGRIRVGDYLLSINRVPLNGSTNLELLLENQIGAKVILGVGKKPSGDAADVAVSPVNLATEKRLLYRQWVQDQRDYVEKISNGKLGYVHMFDMSAQSLDQLHLDLDATNINKQGIVVDVRNNNGGFVNAYALDVFARQPYLTMTPRGLPSSPARTQLGQRAFSAPTVLITNQHSLSDAEDFSEGYRSLKLGKVVGEPTGGWIIYTSSARLVDGSVMRLPFIRITDNAGKDMELVPRPVDIPASSPVGETYTKKITPLDVAVAELLKQVGK